MVCESWRAKLDNYLDGELPSEEMRAFGTHVQSCRFCATDALVSVQLKRSIQAAGKRFTPSAEFRRRVQQSIAAKPRRGIARFSWMIATAMIGFLLVAGLAATYLGRQRAGREQVYSHGSRGRFPSHLICLNFRTPNFRCWAAALPILAKHQGRT